MHNKWRYVNLQRWCHYAAWYIRMCKNFKLKFLQYNELGLGKNEHLLHVEKTRIIATCQIRIETERASTRPRQATSVCRPIGRV